MNTVRKHIGGSLPRQFEIQAKDLNSRRGVFKDLSLEVRPSFRDEILQLLLHNEIKVIYRRIIKKRFAAFCEENYGPVIKVNPYIMALPFVEFDYNKSHVARSSCGNPPPAGGRLR